MQFQAHLFMLFFILFSYLPLYSCQQLNGTLIQRRNRKLVNCEYYPWYKDMLQDAEEVYGINSNDYKVIGKGGQAEIYRVHKTENNIKKSYVLKLTDTKHAEDLKLEYALTKNLNYPYIVKTLGHRNKTLWSYNLLNYYSNGDLGVYLDDNRKKITMKEKRKWMAQIVLAVEYVHKKDIAHRDIKSDNFLLDEHFNVHLSDFGLARISKEYKSLTGRVGTLGYQAPEVSYIGEKYGKEVDWFSVGMTFYDILVEYPSDNKDLEDIFGKLSRHEKVESSLPLNLKGLKKTASDLIKRMTLLPRSIRLGYGGPTEIKKHPFFEKIDWEKLALGI